MSESTRTVEFANNKRVDELAIVVARLESRVAALEKRKEYPMVTYGVDTVAVGKTVLLKWDEESKSYKNTFKF